MLFLFQNFQIFLIVFAAVLLGAVFGVFKAKTAGEFDWRFLPDFINNMIKYTIYLMFGNLIDFFSQTTGLKIDGWGLNGIALIIILVEGASIISSIKELNTKK